MENFEMVEKLVEKAGVSYEEAKTALEESNGDILDAMIILEKKRKAAEEAETVKTAAAGNKEPEAGTAEETAEAVTRNAGSESRNDEFENRKADFERRKEEWKKERKSGWDNFKAEVKRIAELSVRNTFQVRRKGETLIAVPTLALIILLICVFWFTLILLIVGLFFGCRYSFEFTGKAADTVNEFLGKAADTAETIKKDFSQDNSQEKDNE